MHSKNGTNIYETEFFASCPTNQIRVCYKLKIETHEIIKVEEIIAAVESIRVGFHEDIANKLFAVFEGRQTLVANHHSIIITTIRP